MAGDNGRRHAEPMAMECNAHVAVDVWPTLDSLALGDLGGEDEADDKAVETERLGEDENEDHAHVQLGLLSRSAHARIAHNADRNARSHAAQATRETGRQVRKTGERGVLDLSSRGRHLDWRAAGVSAVRN